jgi:hypothetical protein
MVKIAKLISVIFHPVFIPCWLIFILLWFCDNSLVLAQPGRKTIYFITFSVFMTILPLLNIMILKYMGYVSGFEMENKKERNLPLFICLVYYAGLFYLLLQSDIMYFYHAFVLSGFVLLLFNYLVNLKWKISAHAIGAGGLCGTFIIFSFLFRVNITFFISISFLLSGLIMTSRLVLKKHTNAQVYIGYIAGLILTILVIPVSMILIYNSQLK